MVLVDALVLRTGILIIVERARRVIGALLVRSVLEKGQVRGCVMDTGHVMDLALPEEAELVSATSVGQASFVTLAKQDITDQLAFLAQG